MTRVTDQYVVDLAMPTACQVKELLMLCQLLEIVAENRLRISFWKNKLSDKKWTQLEADFFDGLKLVGLIFGWRATESSLS